VTLITTQSDLEQLCLRLRDTERIGIDTEFVSEDTFYSELCLIQVATLDEMVVIDPQQVDVEPFWKLLVEGDHVTILHAGREELNFILHAVDRVPKDLFDIQIGAGFCSHEYPAAYGSVVSKFIGHKPQKGQQRTDWRRRPLSNAQTNYALEDVRYLIPVYDRQLAILREKERESWFLEEMGAWQAKVIAAQDRLDWRRISGIGKLNARGLAIARQLWLWRHEEARRSNKPPKRVMRDDLIVELARHQIDRAEKITAIRGMQRAALRRKADELAQAVQRGMEAPPEHASRTDRHKSLPQLNLLGQYLTPALGTICRRATIAASLVGTASDVRELIAYRLGLGHSQESWAQESWAQESWAQEHGTREQGTCEHGGPSLCQGWRAEVVGNLIDDLLQGKKSIRIHNPRDEDPLVFEER